jgi:hypothetical protein
LSPRTKKADVVEHPKVFGHVGLLFNKPPGKPGCSSSSHPTACYYNAGNGECNKPWSALLQLGPQKHDIFVAASSQPSQDENQVPAWVASMSDISR